MEYLCDATSRSRDAQEINAFKALEDPAHRRSGGRLVKLVGKGLLGLDELGAEKIFGKTIDQQTEYHNEAQGHNPLRFLEKH